MRCPHCQSETVVKNGTRRLRDNRIVQYYRCRGCTHNFNERTGTPMARLRTPSNIVEYALNSRTEGTGVRATGRVYNKSHATILRWEERLALRREHGSPPAPEGREITLEGDERYTRVGENLSPQWEWQWAQGATAIRWFTDGERRYGKALWPLASEYLLEQGLAMTYPFRKVWREGLEVAIKIKGSQGQRRVVWLKVDHPFTAISPASEDMRIIMKRTVQRSGDGVAPTAAAKTSMPKRRPGYSEVWMSSA